MAEPSRNIDYNEEQYFNRKLSNHYNYDRPQASVSQDIPNTRETYEELNSRQFVVKKKWKLSKFEISWLTICGILSVIAISASFIVRSNVLEQKKSINALEASIAKYQSSTKVYEGQITEQYNYDRIKEVAAENGLSIDKDRVRTVGE
ncbi:hypothetical protein ACF3NG_07280 [Aerococcaceae bacterium WGS1372]